MNSKKNEEINIEQADKELQQKILKEPIMWKFRFYGFLKNLRFFEPFLLLILLMWNLSYFQIGMLIFIRELVMYLFEIPSGMIADKILGRKMSLQMCFLFYIGAFVFYFFGPSLVMLVIASILFGLGEAFRSGTHKSMEMQWMEKHGYLSYKSFIYGRTRAWSLYGSALNAILAIILILLVPADRWVFLLTTLPYLFDFWLISTYPNYMNEVELPEISEGQNKKWDEFKSTMKTWGKQLREGLRDLKKIMRNKRLRKGILTSSSYDGIFKSLKDYIQPILKSILGALIIQLALNSSAFDEDAILKITLGIVYAFFYVISSIGSQNAYRIVNRVSSLKKTIDLLFDLFGILLLLNALFIWLELPVLVIIFYLFMYLLYNVRRPMNVGYIGAMAKKTHRTTTLSVESQMKAIFTFIFAPLFGYIADIWGIAPLFVFIAILIFIMNLSFRGEDQIISMEEPKNNSMDKIEDPKNAKK